MVERAGRRCGHRQVAHPSTARVAAFDRPREKARPSFGEMLACLRRASWAEAFVDPSLAAGDRQKSLAAYLARVVASG